MTGTPLTNPWATPEGEQARLTLFRLHAQGEGALADFAKDVVAGHRKPRDLLVQGGVLDDHLTDLYAAVQQYHRDPPPSTGSIEDVIEQVRQRVTEINAYTPEPPPRELDNDRRSVLDDDDW